jgi:hypothetical protein
LRQGEPDDAEAGGGDTSTTGGVTALVDTDGDGVAGSDGVMIWISENLTL